MLWKVANFKIKDFSLALLSAILLSLPFLNSNLSFFAWVSFIPLFSALNDKNKVQAFIFAYLSGVIFWAITIYWLINVTLFGQILLVLYLAVYFGIFGLLYSCTLYPARYVLFIPSLWVILEYGRSHLLTGFPWALLGYSQYLNLEIIQISDITGVWGVSFLVMLVNVSIYRFINSRKSLAVVRPVLLPVLLMTSVFIYGISKIHGNLLVRNPEKIKISVIQGNIPQELKWEPSARDLIMQNYFELTSRAAKDNPDLIIWPEAALPVVLEEEPEYYMKLRQYLKTINKPLLFGSVTLKDDFYYNSALLLSGDARLLNQFDKLHLVPFGEYIPFRNTLKFLDTIAPIGDITRGKDYTIFKLPGFPIGFGVLICFEDVFPELARSFVTRGAGFLVNITNDAWFGKSPEAYQHLAASVFRAVENRVYLVRCANTGVSAFISPLGKIVSNLSDREGNNIFIAGYCTDSMNVSNNKLSFYNLYGDVFPLACLLFLFYVIIFKNRKKK
jgi:apolipoprotein N-acyltransferase